MSRKKGVISALVPLVITASLYIVFYDRIDCQPTDAGFWFILALGMSVGVTFTKLADWFNSRNNEA